MHRSRQVVSLFCILCCSLVSLAQKREERTPRLLRFPNAALLQGWGPLFLSTPDNTIKLQHAGARNVFGYGLSPDGKHLTGVLSNSALWRAGGEIEGTVASLSILTGEWTEYLHHEGIRGEPSMSRDGSKIAFSATDGFHVFDTSTRTDRIIGPKLDDMSAPEWSPDGTQIAFTLTVGHHHNFDRNVSEVNVIEVGSGRSRTLAAHAEDPAWSPSGEWIAYLDDEEAPGGKHCMLARPDGTEAYVIATAARSYWGSNGFFGVRGAFLNPPVWSPDSSKLLLNVYWDWSTLKTNIYALDLKTHRLALVLKNAGPVWGWAKWDK